MHKGLGASPAHPPLISALQSSLRTTVTQLSVHDCDCDLTFSDYYLF